MEYIANIYVWMLTFVILEIIFYAIYFVQLKIDRKFIYKLNQQVIINTVESAILLAAIIYAGAPALVIWSVVLLTAVSIGSLFTLKWKYSL